MKFSLEKVEMAMLSFRQQYQVPPLDKNVTQIGIGVDDDGEYCICVGLCKHLPEANRLPETYEDVHVITSLVKNP